MSVSVAVAGASGYAGGELLRLLSAHPDFDVVTVTANRNAGAELIDVHPHLRSLSHLRLEETTATTLSGHDAVFLALPHGTSGELTAELDEQTLVIDCGADHRLIDSEAWNKFYGGPFAGAWNYGMPELPRVSGSQRDDLRGARRIAVPGCNATAITLALAPGVQSGLIEPSDLVAMAAVGSSGAGRSARVDLSASELIGSAHAYQVGGIHRHIPEIQQNLIAAGAENPSISLTPVLVPLSRGILATSTARLRAGTTASQVHDAWRRAYRDEPFVHILPEGRFPRTADTLGANTALIGVSVDEAVGRVVIVSAIDNLVKGTAGAALQCANIALDFEETTGLETDGVAP